jgi:hypothetical protein
LFRVALSIPKLVEAAHTRHVKCPVLIEKPGDAKSYWLISEYQRPMATCGLVGLLGTIARFSP